MELVRQSEPLEFKYEDVTFLIKRQATDADKAEVLFAATSADGKRLTVPAAEFYRALVRCFVVGWRGVTENGKEAQYSFESFIKSFPVAKGRGESVLIKLGQFITEHTDVFKEDEIEKNESRRQHAGSSK